MSKDEALEKAIEAGAEDVLEGFDDDERPSFRVIFSHFQTIAVAKDGEIDLVINLISCCIAEKTYKVKTLHLS